MAKLNFYLKNKSAKTSTLIYVTLSANSKRYKVSTGLSIHPRHWNSNKQKAKNSLPGQKGFNDRLIQIAELVKQRYFELLTSNQAISTTLLREAIKPEEAEKESSFVEVLELFIKNSEAIGKAHNTLRNYKGFRNHIEQFKTSTRWKPSFEGIDKGFDNRFQAYLIRDCESSPSNISKQFSILKTFMEWARKQGYHDNLAYKDFIHREKSSTKITLSQPELHAIQYCDLSHRPGLERVRDMFLFCCETSLRYSDLVNLKPINIISLNTSQGPTTCLKLNMVKTRGNITAPLSSLAIELIEKYEDENRPTCFPIISGQKMNQALKEIAKLAGIDKEVQEVSYVGSQKKTEIRPKYELVSTHTARRTFITLRIEMGWTDRQIMVYTGHQSSKEIQTYRDKSDLSLVETALAAPMIGKSVMKKVS